MTSDRDQWDPRGPRQGPSQGDDRQQLYGYGWGPWSRWHRHCGGSRARTEGEVHSEQPPHYWKHRPRWEKNRMPDDGPFYGDRRGNGPGEFMHPQRDTRPQYGYPQGPWDGAPDSGHRPGYRGFEWRPGQQQNGDRGQGANWSDGGWRGSREHHAEQERSGPSLVGAAAIGAGAYGLYKLLTG